MCNFYILKRFKSSTSCVKNKKVRKIRKIEIYREIKIYIKIYTNRCILFVGQRYGINKKTKGNLHKTLGYKG